MVIPVAKAPALKECRLATSAWWVHWSSGPLPTDYDRWGAQMGVSETATTREVVFA